MKMYSDQVVSSDAHAALKKELEDFKYEIKAIVFAGFIVNVVIALTLFVLK